MKSKLIAIIIITLLGTAFLSQSCRSKKEPRQITEEQRIRQDRDKMQFERVLERESERKIERD